MKFLGIETSCDETSASIVTDDKQILSNIVYSQTDLHAKYGGVVPEIASRAHFDTIELVIRHALKEANCNIEDLTGIAVTSGPGLIGGLLVGVMVAKALSFALNKPLIGVNHLEAHALTSRLVFEIEFPFMLMLASGGHCQILAVEQIGRYKKLGSTMDDAAGEAFDKVAKMLGLGYPGGPIIEKLAREGDKYRFTFPVSLKGREGCDFSFSGLKTSVKNTISLLKGEEKLDGQAIQDIAASFQYAVGEIFFDRINNGLKMFLKSYPSARIFVLAGGVAANQYLRDKIASLLAEYGFVLFAPPLNLCTDNAAMVAWAGIERYKLNLVDDLSIEVKPRWPLEELVREM
jgi:N6-L-threonylcarbamoyladenine synthase